MYGIGIDVGSITTKAAVVVDGTLQGWHVIFTGYNAAQAGRRVLEEVTAKLGISPGDRQNIVATGYGRRAVTSASQTVTEIMCHAAGVHFLEPDVRTIVDIGGQDSKAILIGADGRVRNFMMNDKCAAGTGRFLEVMARALEVDLEAFGDLDKRREEAVRISSVCTVFAESEVISLIARGEKRENIIAGIHDAIGARVSAMMKRVGVEEPVMMTGGVAKNQGVVRAVSERIGHPIRVSPYAQVMGAVGAAVIAGRG
ncbi:MAG: acyl-CoA dehydratase activase [Syntrophales bacterium]|nr:acyl-CoA dehydratase activase [Syntrophales bacterium]